MSAVIEYLKSLKLRTYLIAASAAVVAFAQAVGLVDMSTWLNALFTLFKSAPIQ